ncbi:MAG: rod shape-determining protein MreD [Actinomycetota bacterium]
MMGRLGIFVLLMLTAALVQTTFFARSLFFDVTPDLLLGVVICLALLEGPTAGAVAGFSVGLLRDLLLDSPVGFTGLAYLIVGYTVGIVRPYVQSSSVMIPVVGIFVGSLAGTSIHQILLALVDRSSIGFDRQVRVILLTAVFNALLTPFLYPAIRRLTSLYQKEKVYRW